MELRSIWPSPVAIQLSVTEYVEEIHLEGKLYRVERTDIHYVLTNLEALMPQRFDIPDELNTIQNYPPGTQEHS